MLSASPTPCVTQFAISSTGSLSLSDFSMCAPPLVSDILPRPARRVKPRGRKRSAPPAPVEHPLNRQQHNDHRDEDGGVEAREDERFGLDEGEMHLAVRESAASESLSRGVTSLLIRRAEVNRKVESLMSNSRSPISRRGFGLPRARPRAAGRAEARRRVRVRARARPL